MDLVQAAHFIAKSPFGLPIVLMIAVWYTVTMIRKKDEYIETHIKEDLQHAQEREKILLKNVEKSTRHIANIDSNISDIETILRERGDKLDDGQDPPDPAGYDIYLRRTRRKLPSNKGREHK